MFYFGPNNAAFDNWIQGSKVYLLSSSRNCWGSSKSWNAMLITLSKLPHDDAPPTNPLISYFPRFSRLWTNHTQTHTPLDRRCWCCSRTWLVSFYHPSTTPTHPSFLPNTATKNRFVLSTFCCSLLFMFIEIVVGFVVVVYYNCITFGIISVGFRGWPWWFWCGILLSRGVGFLASERPHFL